MEVVQWYLYLFDAKLARALMYYNEKEEGALYDAFGTAKLLLVSIERNIGAWGYIYRKFYEDEDMILDILVCLQKLYKYVEEHFPKAREFVRPGLDEGE
jgi:hypothetical protein